MHELARFKFARQSFAKAACLAATALLLGGCIAGVGLQSPYYYAGVGASTGIEQPPPPLPDYSQPPCPGDGYIWTPGYWAYSGSYYWVPGTWELPPQVGLLWTPGYWGVVGGAYVWHAGYWGRHVGFYGGVDYGFGYDGDGFEGGRWQGRRFIYNRYVTNVNGDMARRDSYFHRFHRGFGANRASYDGGPGGIAAFHTRGDRIAAGERHFPGTFEQQRQIQNAARDHGFFGRPNRGRPVFGARQQAGGLYAPRVQREQSGQRFQRPYASPDGRAGGRSFRGQRAQPMHHVQQRPAQRGKHDRGHGPRCAGQSARCTAGR